MFSACGKRHAQSVGFVHIFLTVLMTMGSKHTAKPANNLARNWAENIELLT